MPQPTATQLVAQRKGEIRTLLAILAPVVESTGETWADAGDLQRVIDGLTEAVRVMTGGEG